MTTPATDSAPPRSFNPTPKNLFLKGTGNIATHRELVDSDKFRASLTAAMGEYARYLCNPIGEEHPNYIPNSAALHWKLQGMHEFVACFMGLSETPRTPGPRLVSENLEQ